MDCFSNVWHSSTSGSLYINSELPREGNPLVKKKKHGIKVSGHTFDIFT